MSSHDSMILLMKKLKVGKYPFVKTEENGKLRYKMKFRNRRFWVYLALAIVSFFAFLFYAIFKSYKSKIVSFLLIVCILFSIFAYKYRGMRRLIIEGTSEHQLTSWSYKLGKKLIVSEDKIRNIYLRIIKMKGFKQKFKYYLAICGNRIDPIAISSSTYNLDLIQVLGRHIATKYYINFFDVDDISGKHEIFHTS